MVKQFFILSSILLLLSCQDSRVIDFGPHEKEIVLNAIISPEDSWKVNLSYTKSLFDESDFAFIDDAKIRVQNLNNRQTFFLTPDGQGNYIRNLAPTEGHEFILTVEMEELTRVRATTYIPQIENANVISQIRSSEFGDQSIEIDISVPDNPDKEDYYVWEIHKIEVGENTDVTEGENFTYIPRGKGTPQNVMSVHELTMDGKDQIDQVDDVVPANRAEIKTDQIYTLVNSQSVNDQEGIKSFNTLSFLSDREAESIEGRIYNRLIVNKSFLEENVINDNSGNSNIDSNPQFQITLTAVSKDLYEYLKTYENYRRSDIKNTSLTNTPSIYSNIENGLGIFGGYNIKTFNIIY